ncbi:MAG: efflux RND transporter permease subunit, partial [Pseudomonadota bacterium]
MNMNITALSVKNAFGTFAILTLIGILGVLALLKLPIQLLPTIERPQIHIHTGWPGAAPEELESTIIEPQENVLKHVPGVIELNAFVGRSGGNINLAFEVGTNMQEALINTINRLNQAPPLPADAVEPFVFVDGSGGGFVASLLIHTLPGNEREDFSGYQNFFENEVESRLRQIPGIANVVLAGARPLELRINFDAYRAAALGISINDIRNKVTQSSDFSGGFHEVGRRRYTVRFNGRYEAMDYGKMIIAYSQNRPIKLAEVADIEVVPTDIQGFTYRNGFPAYYIRLQKGVGGNTVQILDELNQVIKTLNQGPLAKKQLKMALSYDASIHIRRAIELVKNNLIIGIALALIILYSFLRDWRSTVIIAISIPVSLLVCIILLNATGRTLNIISLAGLAFAVGLVLDAAIIVQENIVRLRQSGLSILESVVKGATEVSSALIASTITTVAIFTPILFMAGITGQLFADLALTLSVAVSASLLTAMTLVPAINAIWTRKEFKGVSHFQTEHRAWTRFFNWINQLIQKKWQQIIWVVMLIGVLPGLAWHFSPKADFLPQTKADGIANNFQIPSGASVFTLRKEVAEPIIERLHPYMHENKFPQIKGYNLSMYNNFQVLFVYPEEMKDADAVMELLKEKVLINLPDTKT